MQFRIFIYFNMNIAVSHFDNIDNWVFYELYLVAFCFIILGNSNYESMFKQQKNISVRSIQTQYWILDPGQCITESQKKKLITTKWFQIYHWYHFLGTKYAENKNCNQSWIVVMNIYIFILATVTIVQYVTIYSIKWFLLHFMWNLILNVRSVITPVKVRPHVCSLILLFLNFHWKQIDKMTTFFAITRQLSIAHDIIFENWTVVCFL